jgi:hypothetical protein
MAKKLKVLQNYRMRDLEYKAGDVIDVSETMAVWLKSDAPEAFAEVEAPALVVAAPAQAALDEPPADKMVKRAGKTK